jgi:membrane glycosyltransferase
VLPVAMGLIFSAPVAVLSSRLKAGAYARRFGMFVTPEERNPATGSPAAARSGRTLSETE